MRMILRFCCRAVGSTRLTGPTFCRLVLAVAARIAGPAGSFVVTICVTSGCHLFLFTYVFILLRLGLHYHLLLTILLPPSLLPSLLLSPLLPLVVYLLALFIDQLQRGHPVAGNLGLLLLSFGGIVLPLLFPRRSRSGSGTIGSDTIVMYAFAFIAFAALVIISNISITTRRLVAAVVPISPNVIHKLHHRPAFITSTTTSTSSRSNSGTVQPEQQRHVLHQIVPLGDG
mmetsp:Transcript_17235/g.34546  ORF Transcript_17235/g.34546 Transcript_17235/m.34546 type:complete len:229 (+) Transcript_17235:656-1342(+)